MIKLISTLIMETFKGGNYAIDIRYIRYHRFCNYGIFYSSYYTIMILGFIEDISDKYYDYKKKKLQRK